MSRWTHAACAECFCERRPGREPVVIRVTDPRDGSLIRDRRICCFCGRDTDAGIYYRADPASARCGGATGYHGETEDGSAAGAASPSGGEAR